MNQAVLHQLRADNYTFPHEPENYDQLQVHAQQLGYKTNANIEQPRRDEILAHSNPNAFAVAGSGPQCSADQIALGDSSINQGRYQSREGTFGGDPSGSEATTPRSASSSLAQGPVTYAPSYAAYHIQAVPPIQHGYSAYTGVGPRMIDEHAWRSPTSTHPLSPSSIIVPRDIYSHQSYLPDPTHLASPLNYEYPNQARNVFPGLHYPLVSPTQAVYTQAQMPAMGGYGNTAAECADFPWPSRDLIHTMVCEDGTEVVGTVFSKMEKGFFRNVSDGGWTCYRRNYFAATSWYELSPHIANSKLFINGRMVQALGMRLSAIVDGPGGKSIELIQHTPKRDLGPKESVRAYRVLPTPPAGRQVEHTLSPRGVYQVPVPSFHATGFPSTPFLPRQYEADTPPGSSAASPASRGSSSNSFSSAARTQAQGQSVSHTFERLQFKSATANNGKRRASQQFFILVVELVADIRGEGELHPRWQRVALRFSDKLIVRGRSPSHYKDELLRVPNYGRGGHGGGGYGGPSGTYAPTPLAGFTTIAGNYGTHHGNTGGFRAVHQYSHHASPDTEASPASVEDPSADVKHPLESQDALEDEDTMHDEAGYQQIYDGRLVKNESPITLPSITYLDNGDTSQYPFHGEYNYNHVHHWDPTTTGRHQGQQPGPGYYPGAGDPYDM